ncbi:MAG: nucleotidyltransferase [Fimbriimonadia bacterium]|nr:nucleotidyltransferase [Fimbriimonadia bacterium]
MHYDFKDLLRVFNEKQVRYLVVGGYALIEYTEPRYTKDLDVWVDRDLSNAVLVYEALKEFGAPLVNISNHDFSQADIVYQIGIAPVRIDILTSIDGLTFQEAWKNHVEIDFGGVYAKVISKQDLIRNKRASGRPQDVIDAELLEGSEGDKL